MGLVPVSGSPNLWASRAALATLEAVPTVFITGFNKRLYTDIFCLSGCLKSFRTPFFRLVTNDIECLLTHNLFKSYNVSGHCQIRQLLYRLKFYSTIRGSNAEQFQNVLELLMTICLHFALQVALNDGVLCP